MKAVPHPDEQVLSFDVTSVWRTLWKVKIQKAVDPDNIPGRVFRDCADGLAYVPKCIFNFSLLQAVVPSCFKITIILPVP